MDKTELLETLEEGREELLEMLEDLPDEVLLRPGVAGEWSIKDILAHLAHWEGQLVTLLFQAQRGMKQPTTAHFGQESVDDLNERWHAAGKERLLDAVWQDWLGVRKQVIRRVSEMDDQTLNDPNYYAWLKGVPLYQWVLNDTVEHEDEHMDQIRDWMEEQDLSVEGDEDESSPSGNGHKPAA